MSSNESLLYMKAHRIKDPSITYIPHLDKASIFCKCLFKRATLFCKDKGGDDYDIRVMFHETHESKIDINVLSGLDSSLWKKQAWWYKVNILQAIWICPKHNLPKHHITFHFHMQQYWIASHVRCEAKSRRQGRRTTKPRLRIGDRILSSEKLQLGWNFKQHFITRRCHL